MRAVIGAERCPDVERSRAVRPDKQPARSGGPYYFAAETISLDLSARFSMISRVPHGLRCSVHSGTNSIAMRCSPFALVRCDLRNIMVCGLSRPGAATAPTARGTRPEPMMITITSKNPS